MSRKMRGSSWSDEPNAPSTSYHRPIPPPPPPSLPTSAHRGNNVFKLLARREICPKSRHVSRKLWGEGSVDLKSDVGGDAKAGLISWVEAESFMHLAAKYCPLSPAPRSTIAAAFSPDGRTLASTHGDHTVKIIDCQTGKCIKVLNGHRRTPWVVRFHPICPEILASGSLDHEVRLWDANTANCIGSRDFYRPIASIAFHAHGELLAVASGHKLYIWLYSKRGETSSPAIVLKTRRSLRAVHFHPHGAPFLLTAEVNDLDSSDSSMTLATSLGYLRYPPPTVFLADAHSNDHSNSGDDRSLIPLPFLMWPSFSRDAGRQSAQQTDGEASNTPHRPDPSSSVCLLTYSTPSGQYELLLSPIEPTCSSPAREEPRTDAFMSDVRPPLSTTDSVRTSEVQFRGRSNHIFPLDDQMNWELPFLQGWLVGQSQAGQQNMVSASSSVYENFSASGNVGNRANSSPVPNSSGQSRVVGRSGFHYRSSRSQTSATGSGEAASLSNTAHLENDAQPVGGIQPEFTNSLAATAAAELPCTVKLRIWSHDVKNPCTPLDADQCRLTIPHAVLCSEMGAHFSPCGRFLAACVACVMPHLEADPGLLGQIQHDNAGTGTSPTRHPISAHQVMYELRIYSLEESTFGSVLASRAIRAAHCLTSIQFSPTSEHLLLAYGRRHSSLLKSIVIERETSVPIYTILEVYRVSDMELVRVISSAEDEVNVASFHPSVGGGLVYGTKEGMLRILQFDVSESMTNATSSFMDENMLEVPTYALEC